MRLSWTGNVKDDEAVKATALYTHDSRMLFAYTGVAEWTDGNNTFNTQRFLCEALQKCNSGNRSIRSILEEMRERLTYAFKHDPALITCPLASRKLTISFVGYTYTRILMFVKVTPNIAVLSNFQDKANNATFNTSQDEFFLDLQAYSPENASSLSFFGAESAVAPERKAELDSMISEGRPEIAIREKVISMITQASDDFRARNSVGQNVMVATLQSNAQIPPASYFYSATGGSRIHLLAHVSQPAGLSIMGMSLNVAENFAPKPHRNSKCSCGSGVKFRKCHGRAKQ